MCDDGPSLGHCKRVCVHAVCEWACEVRLSCMCMRLSQRRTHVLVDSKSWRPEIVVVKLFIVFYTRRAVTLESDATIQRSSETVAVSYR